MSLQNRTRRSLSYLIFSSVLVLAAMSACWIVPYRMWTGPDGSYFTFAYIGDEVFYAGKLQPLIPGTTSYNWINGFGDPALRSPFFLDDLIRACVTVTGIPVITLFWVWRVAMPVLLLLLFYGLASKCTPVAHRVWGSWLRISLAVAATVGIYFLYDVLTGFPPWQGFITRIPTNGEYPLSMALALALVYFFKNPTVRLGIVVAVISAVLFYMRPYAAIPWAYAVVVSMILSVIKKQVSVRIGLAMLGVVIVTTLPWFFISHSNSQLPGFADMRVRFFMIGSLKYGVHPQQIQFLALAAIFALSTRVIESRYRALVWGCAASMLLIPYTVGLLAERREVLNYDRFGVFYLVMLPIAGFLAVGSFAKNWAGGSGKQKAFRAVGALCLFSLIATARLAHINATIDFKSWGPYSLLVKEVAFIPAYRWIRENTSPQALILTGEGFDYARMPNDPVAQSEVELLLWNRQEDLFQVLTERRRVYCEYLRNTPLTNDELYAVAMLHRGTLGYPADINVYKAAFSKYRPTHIFWRKTPAYPLTNEAPPIPRGYGHNLKNISKIVYEDAMAEIWEIQWPKTVSPPK